MAVSRRNMAYWGEIEYNLNMIIKTKEELVRLGEKIGKEILEKGKGGIVIELVGDVGAGKTTLAQGIASGLGIRETITSPSFTLSKRYDFKNGVLVHYDFYRLNDPGIMVEDLEEAIREKNSVVIVEWGESVQDVLPAQRKVIRIQYLENGGRSVEIGDLDGEQD